MKITFTTNIDAYKTNCFPDNIEIPPRVGEKVCVVDVFKDYFRNKKLPQRLQVVEVYHTEHGVICELHYNETDLKICFESGGKPYG